MVIPMHATGQKIHENVTLGKEFGALLNLGWRKFDIPELLNQKRIQPIFVRICRNFKWCFLKIVVKQYCFTVKIKSFVVQINFETKMKTKIFCEMNKNIMFLNLSCFPTMLLISLFSDRMHHYSKRYNQFTNLKKFIVQCVFEQS